MYTDLATINSTEDMALVNNLLNNGAEEFWIGLHSSSNEWLWSLEKEGFYGDGMADFRLWDGEPGSPYEHFHCAEIYSTSGWEMYDCDAEQHFVCYNGKRAKAALLQCVFPTLSENHCLFIKKVVQLKNSVSLLLFRGALQFDRKAT